MDSLSKLREPTVEFFRLLASNPRIASIVCATLILGGIALLASRRVEGTYEPLLASRTLSMREIARMTAAFRKAGLADSRVVGNQIQVPEAKKDAYLVALDEAGALPPDLDSWPDGMPPKHSPLATRQQIERDYKYAEQQRLAGIVRGLRGIESATVRYDEVRKPGFPPVTEKWAMVAVRAVGQRPLEVEQIEAIRDTVAGYIGGIDRQNVTVTDVNACRAYPGRADADQPQSPGYACATKRMFESEYLAKIQQRLAIYPGAIVGVNVDLGADDSPGDASGGRHSGAGLPLTPRFVSASIDLPKSYFRTVWRQRHGDAPGLKADGASLARLEQEIRENVQRAVLALLPPPAPQWDTGPQVVVTSYDDSLAAQVAQPPGWGSVLAWCAGHWQLLVLGFGLLGGAAAVFWSAGRARRTRRRASQNAQPAAPPTEQGEAESAAAGAIASELDLRRQISRIVQEHPDKAAEVLTEWLDKQAA